jgi:hypothetical protein
MDSNERPYDEEFFCSFMGRNVRVDGMIQTHSSIAGLKIFRTMTGCTGARLCKKFNSPTAMQQQDPVGCPYHDSLLQEKQPV